MNPPPRRVLLLLMAVLRGGGSPQCAVSLMRFREVCELLRATLTCMTMISLFPYKTWGSGLVSHTGAHELQRRALKWESEASRDAPPTLSHPTPEAHVAPAHSACDGWGDEQELHDLTFRLPRQAPITLNMEGGDNQEFWIPLLCCVLPDRETAVLCPGNPCASLEWGGGLLSCSQFRPLPSGESRPPKQVACGRV